MTSGCLKFDVFVVRRYTRVILNYIILCARYVRVLTGVKEMMIVQENN